MFDMASNDNTFFCLFPWNGTFQFRSEIDLHSERLLSSVVHKNEVSVIGIERRFLLLLQSLTALVLSRPTANEGTVIFLRLEQTELSYDPSISKTHQVEIFLLK